MKRKNPFLALIFILLLLFLIPVSLLLAQDTKAGLQLSPITYEIEAESGESFQKEVRITNVSDNDISVTIEVDDFVAGGEHGEPKILVGKEEGASKWSLKEWVEIDQETFDLEPEEEKLIYYTIVIPEDAEPGGHYGVVRFAYQAPDTSAESGVGIVGSVGQLVLLKVKGDVKETGQIEEFYTKVAPEGKESKKSRFFEKGPIGLEARFKNTGNVHYKPSGTIEITDLFGKKTTLSLTAANVLPDSIRRFETKWENPPYFGYFKAKARMSYSDIAAESSVITFFIIPWKILLPIILALLLVIFLIWRQIRLSRKVKALSKEEESHIESRENKESRKNKGKDNKKILDLRKK